MTRHPSWTRLPLNFCFRPEQRSALLPLASKAGKGPRNPARAGATSTTSSPPSRRRRWSPRARTCSRSGGGFWLHEDGYLTPAPSSNSPAPACSWQPASARPWLSRGLVQKKIGVLHFLPRAEISGTGINNAFVIDSFIYVLREVIVNICCKYSSEY